MARTRAERRYNTRVINARRLSDDRCSLSLTPSGERCSCKLCSCQHAIEAEITRTHTYSRLDHAWWLLYREDIL